MRYAFAELRKVCKRKMQPFTDVKGMLVAAQTTDTARNIAGYVEDRTEKEVHKIKWK